MHSSRERILRCAKSIPSGKVASYASLAETACTSPRAVGAVMRANRNPDVPCHRVVCSDGSLGGFNRGIKKKVALLKSEGLIIERGKVNKTFFCRPIL